MFEQTHELVLIHRVLTNQFAIKLSHLALLMCGFFFHITLTSGMKYSIKNVSRLKR